MPEGRSVLIRQDDPPSAAGRTRAARRVVFLHGWGAPDPAFYRPWLVEDPEAGDHQAPLRGDAAARRAFWAPLDRLIARVN